METLCFKPDLVILCPSTNEASPISIEVCHSDVSNESFRSFDVNVKKAWLYTRTGVNKAWEKSYCILSEGTFSYYEEALPKPHRMKNHILLTGACIGATKAPSLEEIKVIESGNYDDDCVDEDNNCTGNDDTEESPCKNNISRKQYILYLFTRNRGRELHLRFETKKELISWERSLRRAIEHCDKNEEQKANLSLKEMLSATTEKFKRLNIMHLSNSEGKRYNFHESNRNEVGASRKIKNHNRHRSLPMFSFLDTKFRFNRHQRFLSIDTKHFNADRHETGLPERVSSPCLELSQETHEIRRVSSTGSSPNKNSTQDKNHFTFNHGKDESPSPSKYIRGFSQTFLNRCPTVRVNVSVSSEFRVCTIDPEGTEEDTWTTIKSSFVQHFILRGGSHGKIVRGDVLAEINCNM